MIHPGRVFFSSRIELLEPDVAVFGGGSVVLQADVAAERGIGQGVGASVERGVEDLLSVAPDLDARAPGADGVAVPLAGRMDRVGGGGGVTIERTAAVAV